MAIHLRAWLGAWPPPRPVQVVGSTAREIPGWDGAVYPVLGVSDGTAMVLSVSPQVARQLRQADPGDDDPAVVLARALGRPTDVAEQVTWSQLVLRWTTTPAVPRDLGIWWPTNHPHLPSWLRPFNGDLLVALDADGAVVAGAGRKQHTRYGHEIAVVTEPGLPRPRPGPSPGGTDGAAHPRRRCRPAVHPRPRPPRVRPRRRRRRFPRPRLAAVGGLAMPAPDPAKGPNRSSHLDTSQ